MRNPRDRTEKLQDKSLLGHYTVVTDIYRCFKEQPCLHLQGEDTAILLNISIQIVSTYLPVKMVYIPELTLHHYKNLKSHIRVVF
jgi:hypothetical protein